jgi:CheY-like chemotaxis protein
MMLPDKPRSLRIFIVENHPDTLKWLRLYLEDKGHSVVSARSMGEALSSFPTAHCDVLLSDIGLPDGDGWKLLEQLQPPPAFSVAMSGFGMNADSEHSSSVGYRYHLLKPFNPEELDGLLAEAAEELAVR